MFGEQKKAQLIIVCTEKTRKYANYLVQLIGAKDDTNDATTGIKDGSVEAVVWGEKDYKANLATLKSSANIVFIGNDKMIKDEIANMNEVYDAYGMKFNPWATGQLYMLKISPSVKKTMMLSWSLAISIKKPSKKYISPLWRRLPL